jgi:hypothetical protein
MLHGFENVRDLGYESHHGTSAALAPVAVFDVY